MSRMIRNAGIAKGIHDLLSDFPCRCAGESISYDCLRGRMADFEFDDRQDAAAFAEYVAMGGKPAQLHA